MSEIVISKNPGGTVRRLLVSARKEERLLKFDGSTTEVRTTLPWTNKGPITIEFVVKFDPTFRGFAIGSVLTNNLKRVTVEFNNNVLYWDYGHAGTTDRISVSFPFNTYKNTQVHIACVSGGTSSNFRGIYINSQLVASAPTAASANIPDVSQIMFGWNSLDPSTSRLQGSLRDVKIWNVVRTQAEIKQSMESPKTIVGPNLLGYWILDGNANDSSGNNYHGTTSGVVNYTNIPAEKRIIKSI